MEKIVLSFVVSLLILLASCGDSGQSGLEINGQIDKKNGEINSCLDLAISEKYNTLDPLKVTSIASFHITSQIYEPLLRFDEKDLSLQPLIADSWVISDDNLVYTFTIKKGVYFHDNDCFKGGKGRELTTADILYTFKRIYSEKSSYANSLFQNIIKGSEDYEGGEITGLKAIDDYTVEFTLNNPSSIFLNVLSVVNSAIVPQEAIESNALVGSGPFVYTKENDTEIAITLLKNNNYHISDKQGNKLPYIGAVSYSYAKSGQEQLDLFMSKKLDVIANIPPEAIKELVESQISDFQANPKKYVLGRYPEIMTTYLMLNTAKAPFNEIKVRQALGMAIDKGKIIDNVLKGEAYSAGENGIVPSSIKGYDFSSVVGLENNPEKAKELLADAGFPDGKGFPTLAFATGKGNISLRVGLEIQKQLLHNLNINVEISALPQKKIDLMNSKSELNMTLSRWLGEFPDPVTFLSLFYGENVPSSTEESSFPNETRYQNKKFDFLFKEALTTIDTKKRHELCLIADQIIATEVPAIPLWYHENYQLIQSGVHDYHPNSMNIQYLTYVKLNDLSLKAAH